MMHMGLLLGCLALAASTDAVSVVCDGVDLLRGVDDTGAVTWVDSTSAWEGRRENIVSAMEQVMGPLPGYSREAPPAYEVLETVNFAGYVRKTIRYEAAPGDPVTAFLMLPEPQGASAPAMLCLHPTSPLGKRVVAGEGEKTNRNYAQELAERGYVVLAPDYPGFGEDLASRKTLYEQGYVSCTMKGVWNHLRGVDLLVSLDAVDPERIGCIGHSLGGHNTLFVGVFDPRLRVLVTSCGFTAFRRYMNGDLTGWTHDGYMPRIADVYEKDPERMPFDFDGILGALAPRPVFINAPLGDANFDVDGVRETVRAAAAVYALYDATDNLCVVYPDAEHDFPAPEREAAYAFIDAALAHQSRQR